MIFKDRSDAGEKLSQKLKEFRNAVVLAIPRGGVEVAYPVAKRLEAPLGVIVSRKLATPGDPELAIGAITTDGTTVLNKGHAAMLELTKEGLDAIKKEAIEEAARRERIYGGRVEIKNKTVIIVDDGLATGYTMLAAVKSAKKSSPKRIIVAVPVSAKDAYELVKKECDIVCLHIEEGPDFAVGSFYEQFRQLTDDEVIGLLRKSTKQA